MLKMLLSFSFYISLVFIVPLRRRDFNDKTKRIFHEAQMEVQFLN